jgi:hypothetical protein
MRHRWSWPPHRTVLTPPLPLLTLIVVDTTAPSWATIVLADDASGGAAGPQTVGGLQIATPQSSHA